MLIYLAGSYSHKYWWGRLSNIYKSWIMNAELWQKGYTVISPNCNTAFFEYMMKLDHTDYLRRDFEILSKCDILFIMPDSENSKGVQMEIEYAKKNNINIHYL